MSPTASISEKLRVLETSLSILSNRQDRLAWITRHARSFPPLPPELKTDPHLVPGCLARTWLVSTFSAPRCHFQADSESAIIRGIAVLLCDLFSDQTPTEILSIDPRFLEKFGIDQHLTPNRRNSLATLFQQIRAFSAAHNAEEKV